MSRVAVSLLLLAAAMVSGCAPTSRDGAHETGAPVGLADREVAADGDRKAGVPVIIADPEVAADEGYEIEIGAPIPIADLGVVADTDPETGARVIIAHPVVAAGAAVSWQQAAKIAKEFGFGKGIRPWVVRWSSHPEHGPVWRVENTLHQSPGVSKGRALTISAATGAVVDSMSAWATFRSIAQPGVEIRRYETLVRPAGAPN